MVRDKLKKLAGCPGAVRQESAWRAGDQDGAQRLFIGSFHRLHKLILFVKIVIQNPSVSFVIEVFKLALFISRECMLCDVSTQATFKNVKKIGDIPAHAS